MYVFGGWDKVHQISKVENCQLSPVGHLNFVMKKGACTNLADQSVFLCFTDYSQTNIKNCFKVWI